MIDPVWYEKVRISDEETSKTLGIPSQKTTLGPNQIQRAANIMIERTKISV